MKPGLGTMLLIGAGLLTGALPLLAQDRDTLGLRPAFRRIDQFVAQSMQQHGTPGLSLALVDRRGVITARTYGYANLERREPVDRDTRFEIGSISKSFTAFALLQLADSGRFDPAAPVTRYLPWFTPANRFGPITGHHLLTHTSGLPSDRDEIPSSKAQAYLARERTVATPPGSYWAYSNIGYQVLGVVLESITRQRYAEVIRQRLLNPLRTYRSAAEFTHADRTSMATGYQPLYDDRPARPGDPLVPAPWIEYGSGDGAIIASPTELGYYLTMLLNRGVTPHGRLLSEKGFARLMTPMAPLAPGSDASYSYGLIIERLDGRQVFAHSGGMIGYTSYLIGDPARGIGAIVFVNGPGDVGAVAEFALRNLSAAMHGDTLPEVPGVEDRLRVEHASRYAGSYTAPDGRRLTFEANGDSLFLVDSTRRTPLARVDEGAFLGPVDRFPLFRLQFTGDSTGMAELSYGGDWYAGTRYTGVRSFNPPAEWQSYVGHYRIMQPWAPSFRVILRKGQLYKVGPDGDEEPLTPVGPRVFRIGKPQSAERLSFSNIVEGQALTAHWSGNPYFRYFTP